jgi:hypothetical protein
MRSLFSMLVFSGNNITSLCFSVPIFFILITDSEKGRL